MRAEGTHNRLVICVTHTNYEIISGGTEKFVREYAELLSDQSINNLTLFPIASHKMIRSYIGVIYNGVFKGLFPTSKLYNYICYFIGKNGLVLERIIIQHIKNFSFSFLSFLLLRLNAPVDVFIHDYYSICNNTRLISNDGCHCGYEKPSIEKCSKCEFEGINHFKRMQKFYKSIDLLIEKVYVPSYFVQEKITPLYPWLSSRIVVRPHQLPSGERIYHCIDAPIRIAYVGAQIHDKGYDEWKRLVEYLRTKKDAKYEYYYFGYGREEIPGVKNIYLAESSGHSADELLRANNISCALFWSHCGETFSYVYYEMATAGVYVLTNLNSGNVSKEVAEKGNGKVFKDFESCITWLLKEDEVLNAINDYRLHGRFKPYQMLRNNEYVNDRSNKGNILVEKQKKVHPSYIVSMAYYLKHMFINNGEATMTISKRKG